MPSATTPQNVSTFEQMVGDRVASSNQPWLNALFTSCGRLTTRFIDGTSHGYVVEDATLAVWMRNVDSGDVGDKGPTCGSNGGKTLKGALCKRKAVADGRCALHPATCSDPVHKPGDVLAKADVTWGPDEGRHRPIGGPIAWSVCRVNGLAVDKAGHVEHVPATVVWGQVLAEVAEQVGCSPNAFVQGSDGKQCRVDPSWTTDELLRRHNVVFGQPGHLLSDFGVHDSTV